MKRKSTLLATAVVALLAAGALSFSSTAQAQGWGMMGGYGPGYYGHMGGGYGPGYGPMMQGYGPGWRHGYGPGYRRGPGYRGYGPGYGPGWCFGQGGWR